MVDKLIQQEKLNRCHGCVIQHPSQNQLSCFMMDNNDAWICYHDEATWILCWKLPKVYAVLLASRWVNHGKRIRFRASKNAMDQYLPRFSRTCCFPGWRSSKPYFIRATLRTKWAQMEGFRWSTRNNRMPWKSPWEPMDLDLIRLPRPNKPNQGQKGQTQAKSDEKH